MSTIYLRLYRHLLSHMKLCDIFARRGVPHITATDTNPRAIACARANLQRLGLEKQVQIEAVDLFPAARADLIVCNPPWLPAKPTSAIEAALYDPGSAMLQGFLNGAAAHLKPGGEAWLIISDLAEHLHLRAPEFLSQCFQTASLKRYKITDKRGLRNRVMPAAAKRMATGNALECQPAAFECAVFAHGFHRILRAGGGVAAAWRQHRADGILVKPDQQQHQPGRDIHFFTRINCANSVRASAALLRSKRCRTRTTKSCGGSSWRCRRNHSRITRFI